MHIAVNTPNIASSGCKLIKPCSEGLNVGPIPKQVLALLKKKRPNLCVLCLLVLVLSWWTHIACTIIWLMLGYQMFY